MHKNQAEIDRIQSEIMQNKKQPNIEEALSWYDLTYSIIWCWKCKSISSTIFGKGIYERHKKMKQKIDNFEDSLDCLNFLNSINELKSDVKKLKRQSIYDASDHRSQSSNENQNNQNNENDANEENSKYDEEKCNIHDNLLSERQTLAMKLSPSHYNSRKINKKPTLSKRSK